MKISKKKTKVLVRNRMQKYKENKIGKKNVEEVE